MKTIYRLAFAGLLLYSAASCSSDSASTSTSATPTVPTSPVPASPATTQVPKSAVTKLTAPVPDALVKSSAQPANTTAAMRKSETQTTPNHQKVWRAIGPKNPSQTALAAHERGNSTLETGNINSPAPAAPALPDNAKIMVAPDNLQEYFASVLAPAQVFLVRPNRDTVLIGQQGTMVAVPADAWEMPSNNGTVRLEMREFYSTADIILAGLSTRSGANLLETGGMVYLGATADTQPVALKEGRRLLLRMPTTSKLDGMQFFRGVGAQPQHGPDWQLPPASAAKEAALAQLEEERAKGFDLNKDGHWPQLPGGENALLKLFEKQVPLSRATLARLRQPRPTISADEKLLLKAYSKANHKKVMRAIRVELRIDSTGALLPPTLLPYGDEAQDAVVLAAANQLTKWRPARFRRLAAPHRMEKINAVGILSVLFTSSGKRLIGVQWDEVGTQAPRIERYVVALETQARKEGRGEFAAQFTSAGPLVLDNKLYYELEASGLGWMNCDRFVEPGPRIEFAVQTAQPNTVVTLVFQTQRSILASSRTEPAAAIFAEVPAGIPATVVAIRREQGITYLATAAATLKPESQPSLDFKPVSLDELRTALAKL